MTSPRIADRVQRTLERAERMAMKLHSFACDEEASAEANAQPEQAKAWWVVRQAAAEAVATLKDARGAPGQGPTLAAPRHGRIQPEDPQPPAPPQDLDHLGVPKKKDDENKCAG